MRKIYKNLWDFTFTNRIRMGEVGSLILKHDGFEEL